MIRFPSGGDIVDSQENKVRTAWEKPSLVQKPLDETRSGRGTFTDALPDFQS
jgi:hypothetical protein